MPQEKASPNDAGKAADLDEQVTEDLGGVQGSPPEENEADAPSSAGKPGGPPDQPTPDAGEIEWAGQVVKKPPTPE